MTVRVFGTADGLSRALAFEIARRLAESPRLVLGLPTGRTPIPLYRELVRLHQAGRVDFSRAATFNLDEFLGLAPRDPRSYRSFMQRHLFDHVNLRPRRIQFLNGATVTSIGNAVATSAPSNAPAASTCRSSGSALNGHIGFNEPARAMVAWTHCTRLKPATRRANAALFGNRAGAVPREALSMGMATILNARRIVLLATGATKARCVQRMIDGPVTPRLPGSFLQLHRCAEIWLDRAAAARITRRVAVL